MLEIFVYFLAFVLGNILAVLFLFLLEIDIRDYTNRGKKND